MQRRHTFIAIGLVGLVALYFAVWSLWFTPPGVETKGESSELLGYLSLATAIVSLLTAIAGLIKTALEARKAAHSR